MIFDGNKLARELEERLKREGKLQGKKLLIVGDENNVYVRLKREMGMRLGVEVEIEKEFDPTSPRLRGASGVVIQLPVEDKSILELIPVEKDVDGLREGSRFVPAAVRAVEKILVVHKNIAIVGAKGMVGKRLLERFGGQGLDIGDDLQELKKYDVVISATGSANLISSDMVKEGVVAIDLGFPRGDFQKEVAQKASFFTPVPGGVGPVTVVSLFENLTRV